VIENREEPGNEAGYYNSIMLIFIWQLLCSKLSCEYQLGNSGGRILYIQVKRNIKNVTRCRRSRTAKVGKQGKDDSIKHFSI